MHTNPSFCPISLPIRKDGSNFYVEWDLNDLMQQSGGLLLYAGLTPLTHLFSFRQEWKCKQIPPSPNYKKTCP